MGIADKIRESKLGVMALAVVTVGAIAFICLQLPQLWGRSQSAQELNQCWFICTETGKAYQMNLEDAPSFPAHSPFSGKDTGQPAELCYWTAEGKPKEQPTPVLLNLRIGDPSPTFCPDCGRLVVGRNPKASADRSPPPTRAEYEARKARANR